MIPNVPTCSLSVVRTTLPACTSPNRLVTRSGARPRSRRRRPSRGESFVKVETGRAGGRSGGHRGRGRKEVHNGFTGHGRGRLRPSLSSSSSSSPLVLCNSSSALRRVSRISAASDEFLHSTIWHYHLAQTECTKSYESGICMCILCRST